MTVAVPVVLVPFNRPETVARVFAAVRAARPARLLLIADGNLGCRRLAALRVSHAAEPDGGA